MIPTCQTTYNNKKRICESNNAASLRAYRARSAEAARVRAACEERIRAARVEELRVARAAADAAYERELREEKQRSCYQPHADRNKRELCAGGRAMQYVSACSGITNSYNIANESLYPGDPQHPSNNAQVISAKRILREVRIFRQNYKNVFNPETRQEDCMTQRPDHLLR